MNAKLLTVIVMLLSAFSVFAVVSVGDEAPDFTLFDTEGNQFNLFSKRGNIVVLFWMGYS